MGVSWFCFFGTNDACFGGFLWANRLGILGIVFDLDVLGIDCFPITLI